jgi:hypothetical protein
LDADLVELTLKPDSNASEKSSHLNQSALQWPFAYRMAPSVRHPGRADRLAPEKTEGHSSIFLPMRMYHASAINSPQSVI